MSFVILELIVGGPGQTGSFCPFNSISFFIARVVGTNRLVMVHGTHLCDIYVHAVWLLLISNRMRLQFITIIGTTSTYVFKQNGTL